MQYQTLFSFYWLGTCLRFLQDAGEGTGVHGSGYITENIDSFFVGLKNLKLKVTIRVSEELLCPIHEELKKLPQGAVLTKEKGKELSTCMTNIRYTLDAELKGIGAYTPTPKRLDLDHLLSTVAELFAPDVFLRLPEIAQYDLSEAGKCIAFERPTAAAFHLMRATEAVLRFYYESMVKQNRINGRMWGPLVQDLRTKKKTARHETLNNHLDNIRVSFRNPTQHPEARYDIHEVQDLWSVCVDVINKMMKVVKEDALPA